MDSETGETILKRHEYVAAVADDPAYARDLKERLDTSESTANRALRSLEDAGLIERTGEGYQATVAGRLALASYRAFDEATGAVETAAPVLNRLPAGADLPTAAVTGGTVVSADGAAPYRPTEQFHQTLLDADDYRAVLPALDDPRHVGALYEHVVTDGNSAELIGSSEVRALLDEQFPRRTDVMAGTGRFRLHVGEVPPYGLIVTDHADGARVTLVVFDPDGGVCGLVENDSEAAVRWAEDRFETFRAGATRVESMDSSRTDGATLRGGSLTEPTLPVELDRQGVVRVSESYFADRRVADPTTAWRAGLALPEVQADYAVKRTDGEAPVSERLIESLRLGEDRVLVGPPGSGKSTVLKRVACEWHREETGAVFYRESGRGCAFEDVEELVAAVRADEGQTLIAFEDAVRPEAAAVFEARSRLADDEAVFLFDAREREWRSGDRSDESGLGVCPMPPLDDRECDRLVERVQETTGREIDVPTAELREAVREEAVGDEVPGETVLFLHRLVRFADPATEEPTSLEREAAAVYEELAGAGESALDLGVAVNTLNAAGLPVRPAALDARAVVDGPVDADQRRAVERAVETLRGRVLFDEADGEGYRTTHETWSVAFLAHLEDADPAPADRFGRVLTRLLSTDGLAAEAPSVVADSLLALVQERPKLAPLFGDGAEPSVDLPAECGDEVNVAVELGEAFLAGDYYDRAERAFDRVVEADDGRIVDGLLGLCEVASRRGAYDEAETAATDARERALEAADAVGVARADAALATVALERDAYDRCVERSESALATFRRAGEDHEAAECLDRLGTVARQRGNYDRAVKLHERAIEIRRRLGDRRGEARSLKARGAIPWRRGDYEAARSYFRRALDRTRAAGDRLTATQCRNNLGVTALRLGEYETARTLLDRCLADARRLGNTSQEASTLHNLGIVAQEASAYGEAEEYLERALAIYREAERRHTAARVLNNLGVVARSRGDLEAAEKYCERSLAIKREIGSPDDIASTLNNLGVVAEDRGAFDTGAERYERSRELYAEAGDEHGIVNALNNRGNVARVRGRFDTARELLERALDRTREVGDESEAAAALGNLASLARAEGRIDEAATNARESLDRRRALGESEGIASSLLVLGRVMFDRGDADEARDQAGEARETATEIGASDLVAGADLLLGRIAHRDGDTETARDRVARARESYADRGRVYRVGLCDRLAGRIDANDGEPAAAREQLEAALDTFTDAGALPDAVETLRCLAETVDGERRVEYCTRAAELLGDAPWDASDDREWFADRCACVEPPE